MTLKDSISEDVLKAIRSIVRSVTRHSKLFDQRFGLTGRQLVALKEIQLNGVTTTSALAGHISINQSTATVIIDRLVEKMLVERTRDTIDKRKWFISLTDEGVQILKGASEILHVDFLDQFHKLPHLEQKNTLDVLQHVVRMLNPIKLS